ncbi:MAG TPA: AAA family ATPase [Thermomicrobiales bacterium]|jgi:aminoglycoside phosphotransferase family enzyme/predicted kinase
MAERTRQATDEALVRALANPGAYPWRPPVVEIVETHISWVFLAGDRVVKVKRPVRFGFVDHSTLERRRHSCEEEVRLNRRLTDGVYLDVVPIVPAAGGYAVDGPGTPVEWATLMRRLPADGMLDRLIADGKVPQDLVDRLARRLIPFHRWLAAVCGGESYGSARALAAVLTDNLEELRPFAGPRLGPVQLALIDEAMRAFLTENADLLRRRVTDGWVRDGHGDLRPEHVCLEGDDATQIFDCVEFSPAIRCADVASDLAFLLMEFDRLGLGDVASAVEDRYRAAGIALPAPLLRLYRAHRALVHAKIDCLTLANQHLAHPGLADEATTYLNLATKTALTIGPFLVAMTGLSGTGKSTIARALADATGAAVFSSDVVRKELAGVTGGAAADWGEGIYAESWTDRTYRRLLTLAEEHLGAGRPVILDAAFLDNDRRDEVAATGRQYGAPVLLVETVCDEQTVAARLAQRVAHHDSPSDATLAIYRQQRAEIERNPLVVPERARLVRVDTIESGSGLLDPVFAALVQTGAMVARVP